MKIIATIVVTIAVAVVEITTAVVVVATETAVAAAEVVTETKVAKTDTELERVKTHCPAHQIGQFRNIVHCFSQQLKSPSSLNILIRVPSGSSKLGIVTYALLNFCPEFLLNNFSFICGLHSKPFISSLGSIIIIFNKTA